MAGYTKRLMGTKSAEVRSADPYYNDSYSGEFDTGSGGKLLVGFESITEDEKYYGIDRSRVGFYIRSAAVDYEPYRSIRCGFVERAFDEATATFQNTLLSNYSESVSVRVQDVPRHESVYISNGEIADVSMYGAYLEAYWTFSIDTTRGANKPYLEIEFLGTEKVYPVVSKATPAGGAYIDRKVSNTFSWETKRSFYCINGMGNVTSKVEWKGSDGVVHTVNAGAASSVTIPGNTFPASSIQWRVVANCDAGTQGTSEWQTLYATEPAPSAAPTYPVESVIDGSKPVDFRWEYKISTGTAQTKYEIEAGASPEALTIKHTESTSKTEHTFPGGTFAAGDMYWRVRVYNTDGVASAWSKTAHNIIIGAPPKPAITVESAVPHFVIRWAQQGQQAYEVMLDGKVVAKRYGEESRYTYDGYATAGQHTIAVRTQNSFGLWSPWAQAATTIVNGAIGAVTLNAGGANLTWTNTNTAGLLQYTVYRDGVRIGSTGATRYWDAFAPNRNNVYTVRAEYADGAYLLSNEVTSRYGNTALLIADAKRPVWLDIGDSTASLRTYQTQVTHSVGYKHYVGDILPSAEIGEHADAVYQTNVGFASDDYDRIARFEALIGRAVALKDVWGNRAFGVLEAVGKSQNVFVVSYNITVTAIQYEEDFDGEQIQNV